MALPSLVTFSSCMTLLTVMLSLRINKSLLTISSYKFVTDSVISRVEDVGCERFTVPCAGFGTIFP